VLHRPTFTTFALLVRALIAARRGPLPCAALLAGAGAGRGVASSRSTVLSRAAWSDDAGRAAVLRLAGRWAPGRPDGIAVDDTIFRRAGRKVMPRMGV